MTEQNNANSTPTDDTPVDSPTPDMPQDATPGVDLDLDTLVRPSKKVRLNGQIITITPPDLETLFKVAKMGGDLQAAQKQLETIDEKQAVELYTKLREAFEELIPDLKGHNLAYEQIFALLDMIVDMSMPSDVAELEKRGIKLDTDQKKILKDSLNRSRTS